MQEEYTEYEKMKSQGIEPVDIYLAAKKNGMPFIRTIRMLRSLFNLSLVDAKRVTFKGDTGQDDYTEEQVDEIIKAIDAVHKELRK